MLKCIWIVVGSTGEYSDHSEWTVAAYTNEEMARLHAQKANDWLREHRADNATDARQLGYDARDALVMAGMPYDPDMQIDYTGTDYTVREVSLFDHLDQFIESLEQRRANPCPGKTT